MKTKKVIPSGIKNAIKALLQTEGLSLEDLIEKPECTYKELISVKEAARRLGVSPDTVKRRIHDGTLKAKKISRARNGRLLVEWASVQGWLETCNFTGDNE